MNLKRLECRLRKLIIYSSRSGGPYKQHSLLCEYLSKKGFNVEHWSGFIKWLKLHFIYGNNNIILTNVPLIFRFQRKNYFLNIHGNYNIEKGIRNPLGYFYDANVKWAKKIIVPNNFLKEKLKINNAIVIPNFINKITKLKNIEKSDKLILICVTNFTFKDKAIGIIKIIKALSLIKTNKKIVLNIYGDGKLKNKIIGLCKEIKVSNNINYKFCGYSKNIIEKIQEADIFVYWSNLDVSPLCLLEAMGCGLPIVVNNFPSFEELIGKHNYFSKDENDFAKNIDKLVENKKIRNEISKKNLFFYKKYSSEKSFKKWINILYNDTI